MSDNGFAQREGADADVTAVIGDAAPSSEAPPQAGATAPDLNG